MKKYLLLCAASLISSVLLSGCINSSHNEKAKPLNVIEILSPEALQYLNPQASLDILGEGYAWSEGPLWIDEGYLLFSDIPNNVIHKYTPGEGTSQYLARSGATNMFEHDDNGGSNGLLLDSNGQLVLLQQGDRRVAVMKAPLATPSANYRTLAGDFQGSRLNSPNDAVLAIDGSIYFTDPAYGLMGGASDPRRELEYYGIFRLTSDGELILLDDSVGAPNGIALSPDNKTLYVALSDRENPIWLAYDINPEDSSLSNKRVFFNANNSKQENTDGVPDGMAVHSSGAIFASAPGGVWLFNQSGKLLAKINTGRLTSNCALNTKEDYLYITAHDTLMGLKLTKR
ncbi:SMP-30/gluconolactonase/LRE family protein [Gilvimarinus polysaccharolyticus]|uniref:SMP-30/gluconolactonase/LRE family protein n=1 Tax=Gilvimarinus polysaccharolyticus TaxID=863921 RepID=UPI0006733BCB|nr:SMP-30/gluconolactonase/LRE family protein [Gilvimarinus polysaccharolyticus]